MNVKRIVFVVIFVSWIPYIASCSGDMSYKVLLIGCFTVILGGNTIIIAAGDESQCSDSMYRTFDGSCNNLHHSTWGMAGTAQRRFKYGGDPMVAYDDGENIPRGGIPSRLPSPRAVSNMISDESLGPTNQFDKRRSAQHFAYGQTLVHDLVLTKLNTDINCCNLNAPESSDQNICFPFYIPANDSQFVPGSCKNFLRAIRASDTENSLYREQTNMATSFVDASFLYGSTEKQANIVREPNHFLMKNENGSLPTEPKEFRDPCTIKVQADRCPFAGDPRVSEAPNLYLNHLAWVREHNRIAEKLHYLNQDWDNEKVFQETRRIVIAMWQHITYNEYLPNFISRETMTTYGLFSKKQGFDDVYDDEVDPSIRNGFAAGPFRFGHSQILHEQSFLAADYINVTVNKLEENFHSPHLLQTNHGANVEDFARWLTYTSSMKIDNFLVDSVRNKLLSVNTNFPGQDLMSINIQRARDQGVPGYNRWREFCGLEKRKQFKQFGKFRKELQNLYSDVDDVDLFVGGLLETSQGGAVGETFSCIIVKQFQYLKIGDRFWYERGNQEFSFTEEQLDSIKEGSLLSKIFCRNFNLDRIQKDIFSPGQESKLISCDDLPEINLSLWSI